jgi:hypothetical protein
MDFKSKSLMLLAHATAVACLLGAAEGQVFQVVHNFGGPGDGAGLYSPVTLDSQGNLYGTTVDTVFELSPNAGGWTETLLHVFGKVKGDGGGTYGSGVIFGPGGVLYGTTAGGKGRGDVYELTPGAGGWSETILYYFGLGMDGPSGVVKDQEGNLYGAALGAAYELSPGSNGWQFTAVCGNSCSGGSEINIDAAGQLFGATKTEVYGLQRAGSGWSRATLHQFGSIPNDGQSPSAGQLAYDGRGHIYGATTQGGSNTCIDIGCGTIYELSRGDNGQWAETILYNFTNTPALGYAPGGGVILDKAGNIYGTTALGGTGGQGVVYELVNGGEGKWSYRLLHTFVGSDGSTPQANLTFDSHGNLYGTTLSGGPQYGGGVVFEITP